MLLVQTKKSGIATVVTETFPSLAQREIIDAHGNFTETSTVADRAISTNNGVRPTPPGISPLQLFASDNLACNRCRNDYGGLD